VKTRKNFARLIKSMRLTSISLYERSPHWSFSSKIPKSYSTISPGPCVHNSHASLFSSKSVVFGQPVRTYINKLRPSPGPAEYDPVINLPSKGGAIPRASTTCKNISATPGPGSYSTYSDRAEKKFITIQSRRPPVRLTPTASLEAGTIVGQISSLNNSGGAISRVGRPQPSGSDTPGPGHYLVGGTFAAKSVTLKARRSTWVGEEIRDRMRRAPAGGLVISEFA
jgi:hypothetical protein